MAKITQSSTAEYFAKNLQQVGFSSPLKAVLTTLKESVDNSLDACEAAGILPEITVIIEKVGKGSSRSSDLIRIFVEDNGPGIDPTDITKVFGEYLASSKFGKGQCSRGQQGIGISAATTWAQLTNAKGVKVVSKTEKMRKAVQGVVDVDIKGNKGLLKNKESIDWDRKNGVQVEFLIDGRVQLNGDGGIITYLEGTTLVNPHVSLNYKLLDNDWVHISRVSEDIPKVPPPTPPHPHTMKLGEFMTHAGLYGRATMSKFLRTGFSRVSDGTLKDFVKNGLPKAMLNQQITALKEDNYKKAFQAIQETDLMAPSTRSVLTVGEEALSKSINRIGEVDFFSVVTRKPKICDFKPVVVEVALARFINRGKEDDSVQVLRFANRVPLQFDKSACAVTKAIESVNWRSYGLTQPRNSLPLGPYIFAVSVVSPFIKFKNASKETIDSSDELVEEIRRTLMQAGQKLSRHIRKENREADLERKIQHIEKFGPILVESLVRLTGASGTRQKKAEDGLKKLLGRDTSDAQEKLTEAEERLKVLKQKQAKNLGEEQPQEEAGESPSAESVDAGEKITVVSAASAGTTKKVSKKVATGAKTAAKKKAASKVTKKKTPAKKAAKKAKAKKVAAKKTARKVAKKAAKKTTKKAAAKKTKKSATKKKTRR